MKRNAKAVWSGPGKTGKGHISSQSGAVNNAAYTWSSRFEENPGTNPEELVAAAHAGCFTMKLSFVLGAAGFEADQLETSCTVTLENGTITESHLDVTGTVKGITAEKFDECVSDAKANCPVSKALSISITYKATLKG